VLKKINDYGKRAEGRNVRKTKNVSRIGHASPPRSIATSFDWPYFHRGHLPEIDDIWLSASDPDSSFG